MGLSMSEASWSRFSQAVLASSSLVRNAKVELFADSLAGHCLPVTINRRQPSRTSWIFSLPNAYGPYARAELAAGTFSGRERWGLRLASYTAQAVLRGAGLQGATILNSWQLSTDLLPKAWSAADLTGAALRWAHREPGLPVVLRSLTPGIHGELLAGLRASGWHLLPTRQVWLADDLCDGGWRRHRDLRRDQALEQEPSRLVWSDALADGWTDVDYARAQELYAQLYLGKYSRYNPDYAPGFFEMGVSSGWLRLHGLRHLDSGQLCGVVGFVQRDGWQATPVLGYDLTAPRQAGLYRRLSLRAWLSAENSGARLHRSAGAGRFKQSRGAQPHWEFSALWTQHMRLTSRAAVALLDAVLVGRALPMLADRIL